MTQQNSNIKQSSSDDDEIDLIALVKTLWEGRKTIIKTTLIFTIIGLFIAIFTEKEYTSSTTFVPQTSNSKVGGSLGGLAAMAGINLGSMGGDSGISPELYPQILSSIPFQLELLQTQITFEGQSQKVTYEDYYLKVATPGLLGYIKKYTIGLPGLIISAIKGKPTNNEQLSIDNQLLTITREEGKLIKQLSEQIGLDINDKGGYVTISAIMPESMASAELAYSAVALLQRYVIDFKIKKSTEQLEFIKERYTEVEKKFKKVQKELALRTDRNQFQTTALARTSQAVLQGEYDLIFGVYSELSKQLEAQYIQVTEDTPVFTVLKPVTVPLGKSNLSGMFILLISTILGVFIGVGVVFGNIFYLSLKN